jgi:hypothetical protein
MASALLAYCAAARWSSRHEQQCAILQSRARVVSTGSSAMGDNVGGGLVPEWLRDVPVTHVPRHLAVRRSSFNHIKL